MAIPKKGSRKIVVDDVVYRWLIRWKPSTEEYEAGTLNAAVELYENPQSILHIVFPWVKYEYHRFIKSPVTPKHIETVIKRAVESGWHPNKKEDFKFIVGKNFDEEIFVSS